MGKQWIIVASAMVGLSALLTVGVLTSGDLMLVAEGAAAPEFTATDVTTGDTLHLDDYRGQVVLLNIWATDCPPCEQEMPSLQRLHEQMGSDDFKIVAVSTDEEGSDMVRDWSAERDLTFEILHDRSGKIARDYQTTGIPETFIIGRDGLILRKVWGPREWDNATEKAVIRRALERTS